jgi:hypothetical protein
MNPVDSIVCILHVAIQSNLFASKSIPHRGNSSRPICLIFARWGKEQRGANAIEQIAACAFATGKAVRRVGSVRRQHRDRAYQMKDFPNASFPPETIGIMKDAMEAAIATLPDPVSSTHLQSIAETILRTAKDGERDPVTLQRTALLELQITPRD